MKWLALALMAEGPTDLRSFGVSSIDRSCVS